MKNCPENFQRIDEDPLREKHSKRFNACRETFCISRRDKAESSISFDKRLHGLS